MKIIAAIAVVSILLLQWSGAVPNSSVGGPMTVALLMLAAALAVGLHEAWSQKRGVLGWIVNIPVVLIGAFVAAEFGNLLMEAILPFMNIQGSLAETRHPMLYVTSAVMMLLILGGAHLALSLVNRMR